MSTALPATQYNPAGAAPLPVSASLDCEKAQRSSVFGNLLRIAGASAAVLLALVQALLLTTLILKAAGSIIELGPIRLFFSLEWRPSRGEFGLASFAFGSLAVCVVALLLAVPIGILAATALTEYMPEGPRRILRSLIDLLSGIPSVVYGLWGVVTVVPVMRNLAPAGSGVTGYCVLAAGLVLAVMVLPIIIQLSCQTLDAVPIGLREASLSLGAKKGHTVASVTLRRAMPGLGSAVLLAFARAAGETMTVAMVAGSVAQIPRGLLDPVYPLPALIANTYGELLSVPSYEGAVMTAALLLIVFEALFIVISSLILKRWEARLCVQ